MFDFTIVRDAVASDPLVIILAVFVIAGLLTTLIFRRHPIGRAAVRVMLLLLLTIALLHTDIVPYQPLILTGKPLTDSVHAILKIAWWLWAAWFLVGVLRAVIVFQRSPR